MRDTTGDPAETDPLAVIGPDVRRVLDAVDLPAYIVDAAGTVSWVNCAAHVLLGDRVGEPYLNFIPHDLRERVRASFARKIVGGNATVFEVAVLNVDGDRVGFEVRSAPIRNSDRIVGIFGLAVPLDEPERPVGRADDGGVLTPRQVEVLRLLEEGLGTAAIATRLGVAVETARNHIRALLRRLEVHSRLEAVVEARRRGLVGRDSGG
jgi:DNA-binding CsgD family transcriptional regulator